MFMLQQELSKKGLMETKRNDFLIHKNFLTMISIHLFFFCRKVFTLINKYRDDLEKFNEIS